jgi:hypothetical protein
MATRFCLRRKRRGSFNLSASIQFARSNQDHIDDLTDCSCHAQKSTDAYHSTDYESSTHSLPASTMAADIQALEQRFEAVSVQDENYEPVTNHKAKVRRQALDTTNARY